MQIQYRNIYFIDIYIGSQERVRNDKYTAAINLNKDNNKCDYSIQKNDVNTNYAFC